MTASPANDPIQGMPSAPHLVNNVAAGREQAIRPCVGAIHDPLRLCKDV